MFNAFPFNRAPFNARIISADGPSPNEPITVAPPAPPGESVPVSGYAYRWWVSVLLGGQQVAGRLTGRMEIDREEGAAGVATFALYYPPGAEVPTSVGGAVTIDFISETGGVTVTSRRYTGASVEPRWDAVNRVLEITCSDRLQQRVEALTLEQIDDLVGGFWSADVFEATDGRSRWDYAGERLGTIPASLDAGPDGALRVTSWFATAPSWVFAAGSAIYQSVSVELAQAQRATNRVELEVGYRYSRLWQRNDSYSWSHPGMGGSGGLQGFCNWRPQSSDLPDAAMCEQACTGAGMKLLGQVGGTPLPPSNPDPCGNGQPWINRNSGLMLTANWTGGRRWVQPITEKYKFIIATVDGMQAGDDQVVSRQSSSFEIEDARSDSWESDDFKGGQPGVTDLRDDSRRAAALLCNLNQAVTTVIGAHRGTTVSQQLPTPMAVGPDLVHTVEFADQIRARGKVRRIVDEYDFDAGSAVTTISIALMRGGNGASDPLTLPPPPQVEAGQASFAHGLLTQLGMRNESPTYDDEKDGFAGNWDDRDDDINPNLEEFPRRMTITAPEIAAEYRDEKSVEVEVTYQVGIPDDLLEL
ncbi:hypothetical protein [Pseudomonas sp.]|uniref:hypothetical protein n=1 Tax=Pseudomonas sp. TaxID=306 RepID=UPI00290DD710|nr:hypothetical protein [Pseudomonas sp.]MDU4253926.1 hypothetical protein [Pseudomonas sp.]